MVKRRKEKYKSQKGKDIVSITGKKTSFQILWNQNQPGKTGVRTASMDCGFSSLAHCYSSWDAPCSSWRMSPKYQRRGAQHWDLYGMSGLCAFKSCSAFNSSQELWGRQNTLWSFRVISSAGSEIWGRSTTPEVGTLRWLITLCS